MLVRNVISLKPLVRGGGLQRLHLTAAAAPQLGGWPWVCLNVLCFSCVVLYVRISWAEIVLDPWGSSYTQKEQPGKKSAEDSRPVGKLASG